MRAAILACLVLLLLWAAPPTVAVDLVISGTGVVPVATELETNGANCPAGQASAGVDPRGNAEGCFTPPGGVVGDAVADGTTKGLATFVATEFNSTAGVIALDVVNGPTASTTNKGFLTAADWSTFTNKQDALTWGPGLSATGGVAQTASGEGGFLADGGTTDLSAGAGQTGKMQVMDNGELQYTDGAATALLHRGRLTQTDLTWNVTPATCMGDSLAGKLTVNGSNQIVCGADAVGAGVSAGTPSHGTYYTSPTTVGASAGLKVDGTSVVALKPRVTTLVNADLALADHHTIYCSTGAVDRTLTLPSAATTTVGYYKVIKADTGAGACRVARAGTDTINFDAAPASVASRGAFLELQLVDSGSPGNWHALYGTVQPYAPAALSSTYAVQGNDFANYRTLTVASGTFTITLLPVAQQPPSGQFLRILNAGSGVITIARSGQTINGGTAPLTLGAASATAPTSALIISDGANYVAAVSGGAGLQRHTCEISIGRENGPALTDADVGPQRQHCRADRNMTVVEIAVYADAGTPSVLLQKRLGPTQTPLLSSALATGATGAVACAKTTAVTGLDGATTCAATLQNVSVPAGYTLGITSGSASTAKQVTAYVHMTID